MILFLLALVSSSQEPTPTTPPTDPTDGTHLWTRQAVGASGWPAGAISDTRVQLRAPLHRSESIVFQDTFVGAGARVAATPVFVAVGPRVSVAPIDIFDLDLQASYVTYYGGRGIGLLPMEATEGKLETERADLPAVTGGAWQLSAAPTLKLKLGPIIAFDAWTFGWTRLLPGQPHPSTFVYEPFTDLVVAWEEVTVEQQGAVIAEVVPDEGGAFLWVGATARDRLALTSKDRSTAVGLVIRGRPARGRAVPNLVGQALFYVNDADRGLGEGKVPVPNLALLAEWKFFTPLGG